MSATLMKKLSAKGIMGTLIAPEVGVEAEQFVVMGYAKGYEIKPTTFGDSTAFHGSFKAVNKISGEAFQASTLYLPDVASDLLKGAVDGAEGGAVEFGFNISLVGVAGKVPGETGKYEYRCAPLMETSENDPLELLEKRLADGAVNMPRLNAPKAAKPAPAKSLPKPKAKGKK